MIFPKFARLNLICGILFGLTLLLWILRGFGILTFFPGSVIWILLILSIITAILSVLYERRGRY